MLYRMRFQLPQILKVSIKFIVLYYIFPFSVYLMAFKAITSTNLVLVMRLATVLDIPQGEAPVFHGNNGIGIVIGVIISVLVSIGVFLVVLIISLW